MCCSLRTGFLLLGFVCLITSTYEQAIHLGCGRRKIKINYLVRGGTEAKAGHWPWHVAIYHRNEYICGGSIVDENTILTASHCVHTGYSVLPASRISVHVGRNHLKEASNYTQIHKAKKFFLHPKFIGDSIMHDIALIKLKSKISLNRHVQPVCLWTMNSTQESIVGKNGTIVGFGVNEQDVLSDQLKQALIEVVDPLTCIQKDRAVFGTHLTPDMFCGIGQMGVSACNGDSGGGMFFEVRGKWYIRGLVSYSSSNNQTDLCDPRKPTAYTDVAKYLEWIKQYIDQRVLSYESDLFEIDYVEKLRLFNFQNCGLKSSVYAKYLDIWTLPWLGWVWSLTDNVYRCTITLISEWYAVGPANCFETLADEFYVSLGGYYREETAVCSQLGGGTRCTHPTQTRQIKNVIKNPKFDRYNFAHNIALIELATPANTTQPNVKPICVPVTTQLRTNATTNLHVAINSHKRLIENIPLHYVEPVECIRRYEQAKVILNLDNSQLCAEAVNKPEGARCGSVTRGSPLLERRLFFDSERYFLRGLDLYGSTCEAEHPTVYMNVVPYLDWILYNMKDHMLQSNKVSNNSTGNQALVSEWNMLQQQPGREKLRFFNMNTCGISPVLQTKDHVPWIGVPFTDTMDNHFDNIVVLISEWYALAPIRLMQKDNDWRYLILGQFTGEYVGKPTHQYVKIRNIIIPPPDHPRQHFALIELLQPADLRIPYIRPICLPFMEGLEKLDLTELVMSSMDDFYKINYFENMNLTLVNLSICQDRLQLLDDPVHLAASSACAIQIDELGDSSLRTRLGSPFQMAVQFGDHLHYFLYGMNANDPDRFSNQSYGTHLFDRVELADLVWIEENMQEQERQAAFPTTTFSLRPLQVPRSKRNLLNFKTCGLPSSSNPTPWIGTVLCTSTIVDKIRINHMHSVILINEWYAIGPANVARNCSKDDDGLVVVFGNPCIETIEGSSEVTFMNELCDSPSHRIAVQRILVHPQFKNNSFVNDIALIQLAAPVNTSLPFVTPICLPIINGIRSYNSSSLVMVTQMLDDYETNITPVEDRYVEPAECRVRWKHKKANITVDSSNHCVMNQRSLYDECVHVSAGASLYSRQRLGSSDRSFLRGFALDETRHCSYYYPEIYTNTDSHLEWLFETMEPLSNQSSDLSKKHIFS